MTTKKTTTTRKQSKFAPKIHFDRIEAKLMKHQRSFITNCSKQKPKRLIPGQISRPLVSMPCFVVTNAPTFRKVGQTHTLSQTFKSFKHAWNRYVIVCADAAKNFITLGNDSRRGITITTAAEHINSMRQAHGEARQAAIDLFIKISKLSPKKRLEQIRKSLDLEMVQTLGITSEKTVLDVYIGLRKYVTKS